MRSFITSLSAIATLLLSSCGSASAPPRPPSDPSTAPARATAELFAPGVISDGHSLGGTLSPDGESYYFTRLSPDRSELAVWLSRRVDEQWTRPTPVTIGEPGSKVFDPIFSPDGSRLYITIVAPDPPDGEPSSADNWVLHRTASGWSEPRPLPGANSDKLDAYVSATSDGVLYFDSRREGGPGGRDIFRAEPAGDGYRVSPVAAINSEHRENNPFVSADGRILIFSSDRPGGLGVNDLYISQYQDGAWTEPRNLGPAVNTAGGEYCPMISPDGDHLFFTRRTGDKADGSLRESIYRIKLAPLL